MPISAPAANTKGEVRAFLITVIVVCILFIFLFGYNAYSYNRIRTNLIEVGAIARAEANALFWLNIIWIFVALAILMWAAYEATAISKPVLANAYVPVPKVQQPVYVPTVAPAMPMMPRMPVAAPIPLYKVNAEPTPIYDNSPVCRV